MCFESRFGQLSGIQQFISSSIIEIHHFRKNYQSESHFITNYIVKKAKKCQKTRFFVKNVCFESRFGQLSGIQQFILSSIIEIHHFRKNYQS